MGLKRKKRKPPGKQPDPKKFCSTCTDQGYDASIIPHHERISSKACPFYKPRLAVRDQKPDVSYRTRTFKIGLNTILRRASLLAPINDFVRRMTKIQFEASRLANLYVLHELENGYAVGDMSYNSFMRQVFQGVARVSDSDPHRAKPVRNPKLQLVRDTLYAPERPKGLPWNDDNHLSQCISNAAKAYATNCQNHVMVNWEGRMQRWWNRELKARLPFLYANHRKRISRAFLDGQTEPPAFRSFNDHQDHQISEAYGYLSQQCKETILVNVTLPLDHDANASTWWILLPSLWRLLQIFERDNQSGFTMLPIMGATAKYVYLDTTAFHDLLRAAEIRDVPRDVKVFRNQVSDTLSDLPPEDDQYPRPSFPNSSICDHWWAWAFKVEKITTDADWMGGTHSNTGSRRFALYISTDGLSASVQVRIARPTWVPPAVDWYGFDEEGVYHPLDIRDEDRIVALDPGRISPFTGIYGDSSEDKISCTKLEYRQRAGFTRAQRVRDRWLKNSPTIQRINTRMPIAKTSATAIFRAHVRYALLHRDQLCAFYGTQRWLRLRWKCHIAKEKMWEVMVRRITDGDPRTIVALGDASFAHNSRGHSSTPTKELQKRLIGRCRLRMIDEYRTSITCSKCEGTLPKRTRYWQVKVCQDICLTSWNRDVNAARNIREIFLYMNANSGERPWCFRREDEPRPP